MTRYCIRESLILIMPNWERFRLPSGGGEGPRGEDRGLGVKDSVSLLDSDASCEHSSLVTSSTLRTLLAITALDSE
jgi:hypothetical protein